MAADNTAGFDLLIQLSEDELNNQLQTLSAMGELEIPDSITTNFNVGVISGVVNLNLGLPTVSLDAPSPTVIIDIPFQDSEVDVTTGGSTSNYAPLSGNIRVEHPITVKTDGNSQQAILDFTSGVGNVVFDFDSASEGILSPLGISSTIIEALAASAVSDTLQNDIMELSITPPITTNDADPGIPSSFDVSTINDTSALDNDLLNFGIRMIPSTGGNLSGVTQSFIPTNEDSVLMISNDYLLFSVIRPQLAASLNIPLSRISAPCTLNGSVPAPGGEGTLTALTAFVEGNRIKVEGTAVADGTGWDAESNFSFFLDLSLVNGEIVVSNTTPNIDTDVDLAWWVWLLGLGLGALFGGIVGAIVGAIVIGIVKGVVEGIANNLISSGITTSLGSIPPFPLGPIGAGLNLSSILLDDLELRGNIIRTLSIPTLNNGTESSLTLFALDLDTGSRYPYNSSSPNVDIKYSPSRGLDFVNGARFATSARTYGNLTALNIKNMSVTKTRVFASQIPPVIDLPFINTGTELVLGIETSKGRISKAKVFKNILAGNTFKIVWTTFDTPTPSLSLSTKWTVQELGDRLDPILVDGECCPAYEASQKCRITAWPKLLAFPIDVEWCIDGKVLPQNSDGVVNTKSGELGFNTSGRFLELTTSIGQRVNSEVCVSIIDAKGIEVFVCIKIETDGLGTDCPSTRQSIRPAFELLPMESQFDRPVALNDLQLKEYMLETVEIIQE